MSVLPILHDLSSPPPLPTFGMATAFLSIKGRTLLIGRLRVSQAHCTYCGTRCGRRTSSLDHVIPESRGGATTETNLVLACQTCNGLKDSRTGDEFVGDLLRAVRRFRQRRRELVCS